MFSLWTRLIRKTVKPEVPAPLRRWPISRRWLCTKSEGDEGVSRQTEELVDLPAVAILGSAGTGKTFELNHLLQLEHARGRDVRHASLALLASGGKGLPQSLEELSKGAGSNTVICLDSLDEAIIPDRFAAAKLVEWLKSLPAEEPPRLRIACRSAVFTPDVAGAMGGLFKKRGGVTTAVLQPLDEAAIRGVATARNLDADEFLASVASAGATLLCQHPLTLSMLLDLYAKHESLPGNRNELFRLGTLTLAQERDERRSKHTHNTSVPAEEVLNAAGYLACLTLLGGKEVVDRSDAPRADALPVLEITYLADHLPVLTLDRLDAVAASGLCEGAGNRCFRFIHRQVAEYLAGMTIGRLPLHQARSLLESGLGWRMGVASPLRETAAFAAMANERIAEWIAETDPMVFGLSGVVQDDLRRRATLALVRKFTSRELTDAQVNSHSNEYLGLRYANAVNDLRPLLQDRSPGRDDILEFVVELAREWKLSELSDDLAALFLDNIAPEHPRIAAGYALRDVGTQEAKQRMKALLQDGHNDPQHQLRGLALRCNWPDRLTDTEVLTALRVSPSVNFSGAYEGFVFELADSRFAADGDRLAGLEWARLQIRRGRNHDSSSWRIAMRIAHAACKELSVLGVREHLARLLLRASDQYSDSPLGTIRYTKYRSWTDKEEIVEPSPLSGDAAMRRALIDEMAHLAPIEAHLWWIVRGTPHLLEEDDFLWLLERATDAGYTDSARHHYADLARTLFHPYRLDKLEAWYAVRDTEPVRTMMNYPVVMEVNSNVADRARRDWETLRESEQIPQHEPITPPPNERIQELLTLCETKDVRYFHRLCREMTLDENSTHYGVERALISTPGWLNGSATTRQRVVNAAKRFLESDVESIDAAVKEPLNCVLTAGMAAIWLIADTEPANGPLPVAPMKSWWNRLLRRFTSSGSKQSTQDVVPTLGWLASRDVTWWSRWSWYILRELHPNMSGEAQETKARLLTMLRVNAGESVRTHVLENATSTKEGAAALLQSLLPMLEADADPLLDDGLATLIQQGSVPADRLQAVASFVLRSADVSVSQLCLARMKATVDVLSDSSDVIREAEVLAVALLTQGDWATWDQVVAELKSRPEFSRRVLAHYAHGERLRFRREDARQSVQTITSARIGAVVALLFEAYPPDRDPTREGAYFAGPDDSARDWRSQLLNGLSERGDEEALAALKSLERNFGSRFPWLRRPRSRAEKVYVGSRWSPIPLGAIARMFGDQATHLLRSPQDVLDGMLAALESYDASLHASTPSPLENFWNVPTGGPPTPKEEERASDLICEVIRQYFRGYALAADREVQVYRRPVRGMPGKPGSEVDVCVTVPASGTVTRDAIAAIVEVKLSKNPGVKTDLRSQLVDRYMVESGADACLYVVAWMTATGMDRRQAPKWSSIQDARTELSQQAENARESQGVPVAAFVMDCSLE